MSTEELKGALMQMGGTAVARASASETSAAAVAAQARAMVEARYAIAYSRPRDWDVVRQKLMMECRRPAFANNKSAFYVKPVGKGITGLGIRFTEVAIRCMTNVTTEVMTTYEDDVRRIVRVTVTDLENNTSHYKDVTITKTVERSKPEEDGTYISSRKNSYGKNVYTVSATDDDLLNKEGALVSKAVRTLGFRIIPGDLQDEAEAIILQVRKNDAAKDPTAARKALVDAFGELGVSAEHLKDYLGHGIGDTTPDEIVDLRGVYGAIRDDETTWSAVMENRRENRQQADGKKAPKAADPEKKSTPPPADAPVDKATGEVKDTPKPPDPQADEPPPGAGRLYPADAASVAAAAAEKGVAIDPLSPDETKFLAAQTTRRARRNAGQMT